MDYNSQIKEVEEELSNTSFLKNYNGLLLSKKHIDILDRYDIDYRNYNSINSLLFDIEEYLNDSYEELEDLEWVESDLAERNYYQNTNK